MCILCYFSDDFYCLPLGVFDSISDFVINFLSIPKSSPFYRRAYIRVSVALHRGTCIKILVGSKVRALSLEKVSS